MLYISKRIGHSGIPGRNVYFIRKVVGTMKIKSAGLSDVGILRDHNEDSYVLNDQLHFYLVADGMGGHGAGGRASQMAVDIIEQSIIEGLEDLQQSTVDVAQANGDVPPADAPDALEDTRVTTPQAPAGMRPKGTLIMGTVPEEEAVVAEKECDPIIQLITYAIQNASGSILEESKLHPELSGMGTTATCMLIWNDQGYFGHVGDSRLYRIRNESIEQITEDHSLVHEHVKAGILNEEEARLSQFKNIITRSVGFDPRVAVDTGVIDIKKGDRFLMCSDGLSNLVTDDEMQEIVTRQDLQTSLKFHVNLANSRGGDDNITVIIIEIN